MKNGTGRIYLIEGQKLIATVEWLHSFDVKFAEWFLYRIFPFIYGMYTELSTVIFTKYALISIEPLKSSFPI